ncbi:hypothetical protein [Streptomyces endophytica]|uniref:Uncharacterized protein n=1 Tax=Streptomyces endophytica TaxID=2991496 RepID=A0ABY6PAE2_9ACTN|nr:hypothetical protein [Streptomyces endophytica]UZJ30340.1 hypothetical protein OJ254_08065 [Streptomyces endophytica]
MRRSGMRLLPWSGPDGQPCYLSTDHSGGFLSQLADDMEEVQVSTGEEVLARATELLREPARPSVDELRFCVHRLCEALRDALRIVESRGGRTG